MPIAKTFACAVLAVACGVALGQDAAPVTPRHARPPQKPYTMVLTEVRTQTFGNGMTVTHTSTTTTYRDSEWRQRTDRASEFGGGAFSVHERVAPGHRGTMVMVTVYNPAEGEFLNWTVRPGTAHEVLVTHLGEGSPTQTKPADQGDTKPVDQGEQVSAPVAHMVREKLGTKILQGLTVEGQRTTITYPANFNGNDMPYTSVQESWMARGLGVIVESSEDSPTGKNVTTLTSFTPGDPDPAVFKAPEGYTVRDRAQ